MHFYKLLKNYLLSGQNLSNLNQVQTLKQLEVELENKKNFKVNENIINVMYQNKIFNLDLTKPNLGINLGESIWNDLLNIENENEIIFSLKRKLNILKITNNFYILKDQIKKVNLTFIDGYSNKAVDVIGLGIKISYPLEINLILKYDQDSNFNFIDEIFENKDAKFTFEYINYCQIRFKIIQKIYSSEMQNLFSSETKNILDLNSNQNDVKISENNKKTTLKSVQKEEENFDVEDLFAMFNENKKEKKKIKI